MIRIVKLSIAEDKIEEFYKIFEENKDKIRHYKGNNFLELYQDKHNPCIFFTYSIWDDESDLEHYRQSDLFKKVWSGFKPLFNDKPQAWSVDKLQTVL